MTTSAATVAAAPVTTGVGALRPLLRAAGAVLLVVCVSLQVWRLPLAPLKSTSSASPVEDVPSVSSETSASLGDLPWWYLCLEGKCDRVTDVATKSLGGWTTAPTCGRCAVGHAPTSAPTEGGRQRARRAASHDAPTTPPSVSPLAGPPAAVNVPCFPGSRRCRCLAAAGHVRSEEACLAVPLDAPQMQGVSVAPVTAARSWRRDDPRMITLTAFASAYSHMALLDLHRCDRTACVAVAPTPTESSLRWTDADVAREVEADLFLQATHMHAGLDPHDGPCGDSAEARRINALPLPFAAAAHVTVHLESSVHFPDMNTTAFHGLRGFHVGFKPDQERCGRDVQVSFVEHSEAHFRAAPLPWKDKTGLIAWFGSDCIAWRNDYVSALAAELRDVGGVDSFGACLQNRDVEATHPHCAALGSDRRAVAECVMRHYKFYLAIENTLDDDWYVTEKLYRPLAAGAVPVYFGSATAAQLVPAPHAYIDARNFPSVAALAAFLRLVASDEGLYGAYLAWKTQPFGPGFLRALATSVSASVCRLCDQAAAARVALQDAWLQRSFVEDTAVTASDTDSQHPPTMRVVVQRQIDAEVPAWLHNGCVALSKHLPRGTAVVVQHQPQTAPVLDAAALSAFVSVRAQALDSLLATPELRHLVEITLGQLAALALSQSHDTPWTLLLSDAVVACTRRAAAVAEQVTALMGNATDACALSEAVDVVVLTASPPVSPNDRGDDDCTPGAAVSSHLTAPTATGMQLLPLLPLAAGAPRSGAAVYATAVLFSLRAARAFTERGPVHTLDHLVLLSPRMQHSLNMYAYVQR
jgi:hypothetical protein